MPRLAAVLVLFTLACAEPRAKQPAPGANAQQPTPPDSRPTPIPEPDPTIDVADADRSCSSDADCTAILTQCSMCEGACTGVRLDRAERYGTLDCSGYRGAVCNYDCRPRFEIEAPRCVAGRCESVRIR
jgi:hypothetical protein